LGVGYFFAVLCTALITKSRSGGERNIIKYIQNICFQEMPSLDGDLENLFGIEGGACSINENY